jgi:uncharacterized membrane protein (UPF0127 family)
MSSRRRAAILAFALALGELGCGQKAERVVLAIGGTELSVEVARTERQREKGLMGRKNLGAREGMIFVFDRDDHLEFWMKNTPVALSIAFLSSEGKVLQIEDMEPYSIATVRSRLSARYALELRKGTFRDLGVKVGDTVVLPRGLR